MNQPSEKSMKIARGIVEGVWRTWRKLSKEQKRNEETLDNIFIERVAEALDSASKLPKQEYIGQSPKVEESDRERVKRAIEHDGFTILHPTAALERLLSEIRAEAQSPVSDVVLNALAYDYTTENGGDSHTRDAFKAGFRAGRGMR